ncbi:MAG TPA: UDP-N-acetylmuramoyl-L-alanyl-D-glutamate--2,6-diaminopimelate ligase [Jiangellales bacterium]|nr:UDP-N-acetylmuramoyl-L-alanyl-D-glutamate--2,6-diaminopimelate ligase [Jiangellales bacterium]
MSARSGPRPLTVTPRPLTGLAALLGTALPTDAATLAVTGVTLDSRRVVAGDLYAGLPGAVTHGARFAGAAAAAGAVVLLTDDEGVGLAAGSGLPALVVADPRARLGEVAAEVYGQPGRDLILVGVTGTNGKTTTTYLLDSVLRRAHGVTGLIGTVETRIGDEVLPSVRTTPEAPDVHALLAVMRERGVRACAMEVSSHALALGRVDGVVFDVAVFTNLSQDHLDFHGSMQDYYATKAELLTGRRSRRGVVCVDDPYGMRAATEASVPVVTVSTGPTGDADWRVLDREPVGPGATTRFVLAHRDGRRLPAVSPLPGDFNVANAALAVVTAMEAGVDPEVAAAALATSPGVPGRMERVHGAGADEPLAVVDYAHTPDAVAGALRALRPATTGRLVVVLGAGGDRDAGKRPLMGEAAARWADVVVVTDDNPRSEPPGAIRAAVLDGTTRVAPADRADVIEVAGRADAVQVAVGMVAGGQDTVLVAGKGHEQGQEVAGVVHPFDDRVVLRAALQHRESRPADRVGDRW